MSKKDIIEKNLKMSADFNAYILKNPDTILDLPEDFCVVFEIKSNKEFSKNNLKVAKNLSNKGSKCYVATKERTGWILKTPVFN